MARSQSESGVWQRQGSSNAGLMETPDYIGSSSCLDDVSGGQGPISKKIFFLNLKWEVDSSENRK